MFQVIAIVLLFTNFSQQCRSSVTKIDDTIKKVNLTILSLPIPDPKYMKIEDPAHVTIRWDPVKVSEDNPILGFKVKLWEDEKKKIVKLVEKDGKTVLVDEWIPVEKDIHALPTHAPALEAVVPPDVFEASFDVKPGEHYELRAQTYNVDGDGPLSSSFGFRIHSDEESRVKQATSDTPPPGDGNVKVTILSSNLDNI